MPFAAIAPWIIESWWDAIHALSFDIPTLALDGYQARVALAIASCATLAATWSSMGRLPWRPRLVAHSLMSAVLLAPVAEFAHAHSDAMARWRMALATAAAMAADSGQAPDSVPPVAAAVPVTSAVSSAAAIGAVSGVAASGVAAPTVAAPTPALEAAPAAPQPAPPVPKSAAATPIPPPHDVVAILTQPPASSAPAAPLSPTTPPVRPLSQRPPNDTVSILYGTNRAQVAEPFNTLRFSNAPAAELSLGRADITASRAPSKSAHDRVWPTAVITGGETNAGAPAARSFAVTGLTTLTVGAFHEASVSKLAISKRDKSHALVVIPGSTMDFEAALYRTAQLTSDLRFDGAPFLFSWPSSGNPSRYPSDREAAKAASPQLAAFLKLVAAESGATSISLLAHGLGAELTIEAIARVMEDLPPGIALRHVILVAPDMGRAVFSQRWAAVSGALETTTLYIADTDRALNVSRRYTGAAPRAGDRLAGAPLVLPGLQTVDVTATGTDAIGLAYPGYVDGRVLTRDIALRLRRGDLSQLPAGFETVRTPQGSYLRSQTAVEPHGDLP